MTGSLPMADGMEEVMCSYVTGFSEVNYKNPVEGFNIGAENPAWGGAITGVIAMTNRKNVVEVGYQGGGATIPIACYCHWNNIKFCAYDNHQDSGSGAGHDYNIKAYLSEQWKVPVTLRNRAFEPLKESLNDKWDMVIFDHDKRLTVKHIQELLEADLVTDDLIVMVHDMDVFSELWEPLKLAMGDMFECSLMTEGVLGVRCPNAGLLQRVK